MQTGIFQILWLILYWYYVEQIGEIEKGYAKRLLGFSLTAGILVLSIWLPACLVWLLLTAVILLYDLFFDKEPFAAQWWRIWLPGFFIAALFLFPFPNTFLAGFTADNKFLLHGPVTLLFLLLLAKKRNILRAGSVILTLTIYFLVCAFLWLSGNSQLLQMSEPLRGVLLWGGALLETLLFLIIEGTLYFYKKGYEFQTEQFRRDLMEHQYEEIKGVYMDMRGWRHDYHNHMQVMKAQLALGNLEEIQEYLNALEKELDHVDTLVKSGNLMTDAILNSKLTLARRQKIRINCNAKIPERISVEDVDLCVILGNLMDNALEACKQIAEENRFLRIYMKVNKSQLYLSIQNSAKEDPDFNEQNYITKKRGNHGLGMKRVQTAVEKYQGYLNLANEPGIFAAEVTIPLHP
ncbi:MAG: GHKL domain-containing protein [Lachnospiraceae bacterium]|nr:GHKL domain-containing protein [Lachnospiraceae bacterium]